MNTKNIILLPSIDNTKAPLWVNCNNELKLTNPEKFCLGTQVYHHMYIISDDDDIKEEDWVIYDNKSVAKIVGIMDDGELFCNMGFTFTANECNKIIASTEELPRVSNITSEFIKEYYNAQIKTMELNLEMAI